MPQYSKKKEVLKYQRYKENRHFIDKQKLITKLNIYKYFN